MVDRYLEMVREEAPDAVLISGDIGEATCVVGYLEQIDDVLQFPVYDHPKRRVTVLCGPPGFQQPAYPLPNVSVMIGGTEYGSPAIVRIFTLPD